MHKNEEKGGTCRNTKLKVFSNKLYRFKPTAPLLKIKIYFERTKKKKELQRHFFFNSGLQNTFKTKKFGSQTKKNFSDTCLKQKILNRIIY